MPPTHPTDSPFDCPLTHCSPLPVRTLDALRDLRDRGAHKARTFHSSALGALRKTKITTKSCQDLLDTDETDDLLDNMGVQQQTHDIHGR